MMLTLEPETEQKFIINSDKSIQLAEGEFDSCHIGKMLHLVQIKTEKNSENMAKFFMFLNLNSAAHEVTKLEDGKIKSSTSEIFLDCHERIGIECFASNTSNNAFVED